MAKKQQQSISINLAKKKGNASLDAFMHWAITIGRFLVILTETVALAAFLYRFVLDRQVVDLNDKIKGKQTILSSLSSQEILYRSLQNRIALAKEQDTISQKMPVLFSTVIEEGQGKVTFNSYSISDGIMRMEVSTSSITLLNSFVSSLRAFKEIEEVSIDRIENRSSTAVIAVTISAQLTTEFVPKKIMEVNK